MNPLTKAMTRTLTATVAGILGLAGGAAQAASLDLTVSVVDRTGDERVIADVQLRVRGELGCALLAGRSGEQAPGVVISPFDNLHDGTNGVVISPFDNLQACTNGVVISPFDNRTGEQAPGVVISPFDNLHDGPNSVVISPFDNLHDGPNSVVISPFDNLQGGLDSLRALLPPRQAGITVNPANVGVGDWLVVSSGELSALVPVASGASNPLVVNERSTVLAEAALTLVSLGMSTTEIDLSRLAQAVQKISLEQVDLGGLVAPFETAVDRFAAGSCGTSSDLIASTCRALR